jgi:hypothetical protein
MVVSLVEKQPKEMRMVTSPPRLSRDLALDPPFAGSGPAAVRAVEPEPRPVEGFVVEWQLAGCAGWER